MGKTALDPDGVKALATMLLLDELRAKLVGLIVAPATKLAGNSSTRRPPRSRASSRPRLRRMQPEPRALHYRKSSNHIGRHTHG